MNAWIIIQKSYFFDDFRPGFWLDEFYIFADYLAAINGIDHTTGMSVEKLSKRDALEQVFKKHGLQSAEAVVSHLKRFIKKSGKKFPGILP